MIALELSSEEAELLQELLDRERRGLGPEIRHTHNREFRETLKQRYDLVEALAAKLRNATAAV
ncbi:MAG: hypothetical protein HRF50_01830 [Phycisphaerae bacterium]|jgi:hypothetical protein